MKVVANRPHTLTLASRMEGEMVLHHKEVELRNPVMVVAFRGWNDAGEGASFAGTHLARVWDGDKIARERFFYDSASAGWRRPG